MKKIFLCIMGFAIVSCGNDSKTDDATYTLLSGKIANSDADKIVLVNNDFEKEIKLNKDGTFSDTLNVDTGYYELFHKGENTTLFLTPSKNLKITTEAATYIDSMKLEGEAAATNTYLLEKHRRNLEKDAATLFSKEEADFIETINGFKKENLQKLQEATNLDEEFVEYEKKKIKYAHLANLSRYPRYYRYYSKSEDYEPSEAYQAYFKGIDYDNEEEFKIYRNYRDLATRHYSSNMNPVDDIEGTINTIKGLKSQSLQNILVKNLSYFVSPSGENNEFLYKSITEISSDEKFNKELAEKYEKLKDLSAGKASPTFEYENHKGGTTSLADLKGKYVYIDVWATWCGPCIAEIPSLKKVEEQYHNKNIAFVSISIDQENAYETWKKMVVDKELGGIQVIADNAWKSKFVTDYAIEGIPRFILIDPQGNIVNADAPRPSNPKLIELFDELKI